jgi:hypothetical protein
LRVPAYAAAEILGAVATRMDYSQTGLDEALRSTTFSTALGPVTFDQNGERREPGFVLAIWRDGAFHRLSFERHGAHCRRKPMNTTGPKNLITDVAGLRVGNASDHKLNSGVTAIVCDPPATAAVQVLGGAPGTARPICSNPTTRSRPSTGSSCPAARPSVSTPPAAPRPACANRARVSKSVRTAFRWCLRRSCST